MGADVVDRQVHRRSQIPLHFAEDILLLVNVDLIAEAFGIIRNVRQMRINERTEIHRCVGRIEQREKVHLLHRGDFHAVERADIVSGGADPLKRRTVERTVVVGDRDKPEPRRNRPIHDGGRGHLEAAAGGQA